MKTNYHSPAIAKKLLKIFFFIIAFLFITAFFQFIGALISGVDLKALLHGDNNTNTLFQDTVIQICTLIGTFATIYLVRKIIENKDIVSLGFSLRGHFREFIAGSLIAISIMLSGFLFLYVTGFIEIETATLNFPDLFSLIILFICVAVGEEVICRGYIQSNLQDVMGKFTALIISSLIFSSLHLANPNMSWITILNLFLSGMLLGSAYMYTRNLWFPIGMHFFWNFVQGPILGFNVSGQLLTSTIKLKYPENNIINGGAFGFEGSIICTILTSIAIVLVIWHYEKKVFK